MLINDDDPVGDYWEPNRCLFPSLKTQYGYGAFDWEFRILDLQSNSKCDSGFQCWDTCSQIPFLSVFFFFFFFEIPFDKDLINSSFKEQRFCTCTPGAHNLARIISKKKTRVVQRYFRDSWLAVFIFVNREFKFKFYLNLSVPRKKLRLVIDNRHFITYFSLDF